MYCETCPLRNHCVAYEKAEKDNYNSYHPQTVIRVSDYSEPKCPLLDIVSKAKLEPNKQ